MQTLYFYIMGLAWIGVILKFQYWRYNRYSLSNKRSLRGFWKLMGLTFLVAALGQIFLGVLGGMRVSNINTVVEKIGAFHLVSFFILTTVLWSLCLKY